MEDIEKTFRGIIISHPMSPTLHTLPFARSTFLRRCSPASGMSHRVYRRRASVFAAGIVLAAAVVAGANAQAARSTAIDAHKLATYHFAVTNTTDKAHTVESIRTSCACLKVKGADAINCVPPGGVAPFEVVFDPAGMEGPVQKRVWVTLAPSKRIVTFDISENVRLRLGFKPMDAAFGVIKRSETGREITAKLSGYALDGVKLGEPSRTGCQPVQERNANARAARSTNVFDVRLGADGKLVVAKFRDRDVLPGIYAETWTIPTSDKEIPEIKFIVSARVADAVSVTPQVITVGWNEPVCSRMVMVRTGGSRVPRDRDGRGAVSPLTAADATGRVPPMRILSAETKPRKWGDVKITQRPLNGWRIDIENIDPREVRQFSKRPFLEVKTDLPGMESFEIPLRVVQDGGTK